MNIEAWLKSGRYLPAPLRDFHDQKEVFKAIDETIRHDPMTFIKRPTWIEAQCYVIDVFLWYMARRGYTLQRTRTRGEYRDLGADVKARTAARDLAYWSALREGMANTAEAGRCQKP
jgi:hypothetical protein